MFADRLARTRARMDEAGVDVLLLSVGPDLPWLTGYEAMPLERLTMLVVPADGDATLVVPRLEAARVTERPDVFALRTWEETDDPVAVVAGLAGGASAGAGATLAVGDRTWARFVVDLQAALPRAGSWRRGSEVVGPLRAAKDPAEVDALRAAATAADRVAAELHAGSIPLVGRTEAEVSAEIGRRLLAEGHHRVNFAIVAAGAHAASPHHEAGGRVIEAGEVVLCDFGGTMHVPDGVGYCSDITRCVWTGGAAPPAEVAELYGVLHDAQRAACAAAVVGTPCEDVDAAARAPIAAAGWGEEFLHRTGHGIGIEEHEDPYVVAGNRTPLAAGHAFSVEPGIYVAGRYGFRLEDIVVATDAGPEELNRADHALVVVDAWIELDAATVLLQWSAGGLLFLWVTTRRREVGVGYGWLLRATYLLMAAGAAWIGFGTDVVALREASSVAVVAASGAALVVSVVRRRAGVAGERAELARRRERVGAMVGAGAEVTGIERRVDAEDEPDPTVPEFPPGLDLVAPLLAVAGLVAGAVESASGSGTGAVLLAVARTLVGAAFLGAVSDAMLLGHWYLVQPGLPRAPLLELVRWVGWVWPFEVVLLLVPTGMPSVWSGSIDDGYGGMLGWFWAACAVTTIGLVVVTRAALKERAYSAVMAATGLLYLAILTAFGTDLVARAVLAG